MELYQNMNYYNIRMRKEGVDEECWTHLEAQTKPDAKRIVESKWGDGWRAVEINPGQRFIHFNGEDDPEQAQATMLAKMAMLKAKNSKAIVTPQGEFASIRDAEKVFGTRAKVHSLMQKYPTEYYFK